MLKSLVIYLFKRPYSVYKTTGS